MFRFHVSIGLCWFCWVSTRVCTRPGRPCLRNRCTANVCESSAVCEYLPLCVYVWVPLSELASVWLSPSVPWDGPHPVVTIAMILSALPCARLQASQSRVMNPMESFSSANEVKAKLVSAASIIWHAVVKLLFAIVCSSLDVIRGRCWVRMKKDKAKLGADMPSCSKHRSWSGLCLVHYSTAILLTNCEENILAWHPDHYDLRPNIVSTLLSSTTKNSSLFLHEGCQKKTQPWDSSIWDAHFTQCKPDFQWTWSRKSLFKANISLYFGHIRYCSLRGCGDFVFDAILFVWYSQVPSEVDQTRQEKTKREVQTEDKWSRRRYVCWVISLQ